MIIIEAATDRIYDLMGKLKRNFSIYKMRFRGAGLNPGEVAIIECIQIFKQEFGKDPMPSQISSALKLSQPTITPLINKMEEKELVIKHFDKIDRRVRYISVTEKAVKMLKCYVNHHKKGVLSFMEYLGEEDTEKLIYILSKANDFFSDLNSKAADKTMEEHE